MKPTGVWPQSTKPFLTNPPEGTVGVVLPIRDNLKFFKLAFHSILDFTDYRFMLTIVDNMSAFSTRQYLESIRRNHAVNVLQYQQAHAQGAEWNLALKFMFAFANVHYGVVLTPDVVVEPNWLSRMVRTLNEYPDAIVSPYHNHAPNGRVIGNQPQIDPAPFCAAFKRTLYERASGFDEQFHCSGPVMQDFGVRARKAGFRALCDNDIYVHHFEVATMTQDVEFFRADIDLMESRRQEVAA